MKTFAAGLFATGLGLPISAHADHASNHVHMVKTPTCGCCQVWADRLKQMGLPVTVSENADYIAMKEEAGVPQPAYACHTSRMGRYVLEGHVPPEAIAKLLAEEPDIDGIGVPGMPMGSLGMGYDRNASYEVLAFVDGEVAEEAFLVTGTPEEAEDEAE
jgi:hypothetical protein